jgi:uncharacterized protein (TIGR03382 family)
MEIAILAGLLLGAGSALAKPSCGQGGATGQTTATAGSGQLKISVPPSYSPTQAIPLLFALHGDEGTPDYIYSVFYGLQKSSGAFILVAPKAPFGGGSWYQATAQHVDFINTAIAQVLTKYNIDQDRIWITGWSGGATFLGYYAILRQDILAGVVYHMGGGGGGSYTPPAGSCKLPARFVIGSADFLYDLAKTQYTTLTNKGHETVWIELPGVAHKFEPSTLPETWTWLQKKTLCKTTTPGTCPGSSPDLGLPPKADAGPAAKDLGPMTGPEGGSGGSDALVIDRDGRMTHPATERENLDGGCSTAGSPTAAGEAWLLLLVLGWLRRDSARVRRSRRTTAI